MLWARHRAPESPSWPCFPGTDPHKIPIDPNGNLASKTEGTDTWTYSWNAENELTKVERNGAEVARFSYDPKGRRVETSTGGMTTGYTYEGRNTLRERRGAITLQYAHAGGIDAPLAVDMAGALSYFHADGLGSVAKITDQQGAAVLARQYDAWGNPQAGASERGFSFAGREWDPETRLYYYRARYYDASIGRFISEDPMAAAMRKLRELNAYAYAANNPVDETDPLGLAIWLCTRKAFTPYGPGNHTYFWNDRNGRCCGRGSQLKCKEAGPPTDSCRKVEGSDGNEHKILACCRYKDWGKFFPIRNDCHVLVHECLATTGMSDPGVPGDRFGPPCDPCSK